MAADRVEILGVDFDAVTQDEAVERALSFVEEGCPHQIWTPSITHVMMCRRDPEFAELNHRADLVVADGMPLVWMSRLNRTPLPERVTGADLTPSLCEAAAKRGLRVFFLGAAPGVADEVARRLSQRYPDLIVAGTDCPPMHFEDNPVENRRTIQRVVEARPDFLFVALGTPRQEKWIRRYRDELGVPVMIGVGAAFNFIAGEERRAPERIQRWGLESLWRFAQRPREIFGRIIRYAPLFFLLMLDQRTYRSQKSLLLRLRPFVLAVLDAIIAAGSFLFAYALYFRVLFPDKDPFPNAPVIQVPAYSTLVPFVVLINFLVILGTGLYQRGPRGAFSGLAKRTAISAIATLVLLITFTFVSKEIFVRYSRGFFGTFGLFNFAGLLAIRSAVRKLEAELHRLGLVADRLILIGDRKACEAFAAPMFDRIAQGQIPVGLIQQSKDESDSEGLLPDLGDLADLRKIVAARKIDEIVVLSSDLSNKDFQNIMEICAEFSVHLSFLPSFPIEIERGFRIREVGTKRVLSVSGKDLHKMRR
ncbi:MAG: WecB/TagA/CpsF family glycosyltransferase [bacterium]